MNADLLDRLMKALYDRKGQAANPEEVMEALNRVYPEHRFLLVAKSDSELARNRRSPIFAQ